MPEPTPQSDERAHITNAAEIGAIAWLDGQIENEKYLLSRGGGSRETLAFLHRERAAAVVRNAPSPPGPQGTKEDA